MRVHISGSRCIPEAVPNELLGLLPRCLSSCEQISLQPKLAICPGATDKALGPQAIFRSLNVTEQKILRLTTKKLLKPHRWNTRIPSNTNSSTRRGKARSCWSHYAQQRLLFGWTALFWYFVCAWTLQRDFGSDHESGSRELECCPWSARTSSRSTSQHQSWGGRWVSL